MAFPPVSPQASNDTLEIRGRLSAGVTTLDYASCLAFPEPAQVPDAGALVRGKEGRALRLSAILARVRPSPEARYVHLLSRDPAFAISVPLAEVADRAIVVYAAKGAPLGAGQGGPFRLLVPGHPDECVNVKQLAVIELSEKPGRDTRPLDDAEHAKLHAKKKS
jgi:DMSO/TMAO reductase YedYZ molybdopterin-dependent catalytic subunit